MGPPPCRKLPGPGENFPPGDFFIIFSSPDCRFFYIKEDIMINLLIILLNITYIAYCFHENSFLRRFRGKNPNIFVTLEEQENEATMKQLILHFQCDDVDSDEISELLFEVGVSSVSVEVESEKPDVLNEEKKWEDLGKQNSWQTACLRATVPHSFDTAALSNLLTNTYPDVILESSLEIEDIDAKMDWVAKVQADWKPQQIGDLTIRFPWHYAGDISTPYQLVLEGGAAFGTGDHPTTRLCIRWLKNQIASSSTLISTAPSSSSPSSGPSLLDYGTGSGVLALASLLYGASRAAGTDIDKDSLISCLHNAWNNNLEMELYRVVDGDENEHAKAANIFKGEDEGVEVCFPLVDEIEGEEWDLVVANILAPILIRLAPELYHRTKSGGKIALSGVVSEQGQNVVDEYAKFFSDVKIEDVEDGWVLITGIKR